MLQLALLLGLTTHKPGSLDGSLGRTLLLYYDQRDIRSSIKAVFLSTFDEEKEEISAVSIFYLAISVFPLSSLRIILHPAIKQHFS